MMHRICFLSCLLFASCFFVAKAEQLRSEKSNTAELQAVNKQNEKQDKKVQDGKKILKIEDLNFSKSKDVKPIVIDEIKLSDIAKKTEPKKDETAKIIVSKESVIVIPGGGEFEDDLIIDMTGEEYDNEDYEYDEEYDDEYYEDEDYVVNYTNKKKTSVATVNWKNKKPKAPITTDKLDKQDVSKQGTFVQGYNADGTCDIYNKGSRKFNQSVSWCSDLHKGEWNVRFDYGLVNGKSVCAYNKGTFPKIGSPMGTDGQYCWCRVAKYGGKQVESSYWVFGEDIGSADGCSRYCSFGCATGIQLNKDFRKIMFGIK